MLETSWRERGQKPLEISQAELDEVTPLLTSSGAASLGWRRVSGSDLRDTASAEVLHQSYRLQSLQSSITEQKVEKVFRVLNQRNVDAFVVKGWAAARVYGDQSIRPAGDIDLCVRPAQATAAKEALNEPEIYDCLIDLHTRFSELSGRSLDDLFARSTTVSVGTTPIRVLSAEDHLALLSVHFLKHAGWRPLWLCDIAAAIESIGPAFDWDVCLGTNKTHAHWILSTFALAERLLDADTSRCPTGIHDTELPDWLVEEVLKGWCNPHPMNQPPMTHPTPMSQLLREPRRLPEGLRQRWPNPILATITVNGGFNSLPRFPYQVANWLLRVKRFMVPTAQDVEEL